MPKSLRLLSTAIALAISGMAAQASVVVFDFDALGATATKGKPVDMTNKTVAGLTFSGGAVTNASLFPGIPLTSPTAQGTGFLFSGTDLTVTLDPTYSLKSLSFDFLNVGALSFCDTRDVCTEVGNVGSGGVTMPSWIHTGNLPAFGDIASIKFVGTVIIDNLTVNVDVTPPSGGTVPEPGSLALAGLALAGLIGARRRRAA